jgi:hypothetical protein
VRCRNCEYPLWRTARRECPECGEAFAPSAYSFRPGTVLFRCPHCREGYYGTRRGSGEIDGGEGHLEPSAFDCVGCGRPLTMDEMVLEPAPGVDEAQTGPEPNPWTERARLGMFRAWLKSVLWILGSPTAFIRGLPRSTPVSESVIFAGITASFGAVIGLGFVLLGLVIAAFFTGTVAGAGSYVLTQVALALVNIVFSIVAGLVAGLVAHGFLWIFGGTRGTLGRSMPAILFSNGGANALNLVVFCPCVTLIAPIWWCVSMSAMLREVHRTTTAKAVTASILAAITWAVSLALSAGTAAIIGAQGGGLTFTAAGMTLGSGLTSTLDEDAFFDGGNVHATPFEAMAAEDMPIGEFLELVAPGGTAGALGFSRDAFFNLSAGELRELHVELTALLPEDNQPYRLGRTIFVHRNTGRRSASWLAVMLPAVPTAEDARFAIIRRRSVVTIDREAFAEHLAAENKRRSETDEPPLPDFRQPEAVPPDLLVTMMQQRSKPTASDPAVPAEPDATPPPPGAPPDAPPAPTD